MGVASSFFNSLEVQILKPHFIRLLSSLFRLNIMESTAKEPTEDVLRVDILKGTRTALQPLKGTMSSPVLFIWSPPGGQGENSENRAF